MLSLPANPHSVDHLSLSNWTIDAMLYQENLLVRVASVLMPLKCARPAETLGQLQTYLFPITRLFYDFCSPHLSKFNMGVSKIIQDLGKGILTQTSPSNGFPRCSRTASRLQHKHLQHLKKKKSYCFPTFTKGFSTNLTAHTFQNPIWECLT